MNYKYSLEIRYYFLILFTSIVNIFEHIEAGGGGGHDYYGTI